MKAEGGTGFFEWFSKDKHVAQIKGTGILYSEEVGKTTIKVFDSKNPKNFDTIEVVVEPVAHLIWLQEHLEVRSGDKARISLMAVDKDGRKFTNCTSLQANFETKGDTTLQLDAAYTSNYQSLLDFVAVEKSDLLLTRHLFDSQPKAALKSELKLKELTVIEQDVQFHNNFGICF